MGTFNNSGNLHKSKMATGQILKSTLEPLVLELCVLVLHILGVFWYVQFISDVIFSVQGQDQMLKVR